MRPVRYSACLVTALATALLLGSLQTGSGQAADAREIVIQYRGNGAAIPAPRREGNSYVIAIPRNLDPVPQKLVAPFADSIEGENEVWRFEVKDNASITVAQMDNGTIHVLLGARPVAADTSAVPAHNATSRSEGDPGAALDAVKSSRQQRDTDTSSDAGPLKVDANGSAITVAEIAPDPGTATVKDPTLPLANLDLSVPQSPAFAVLGITPDNIISPGSPRELAFSLLNGVGKNGAFQSGIAIDTVPYLLFAGRNKTLYDYQHNYSIRLLSRTELSFATSKGAQDKDPSLKVALGLHITFFDNGDPRLDETYINELSNAFYNSAAGQFIDPSDPAAVAAARKSWLTNVDDIRKAAKARNWNKSSWSVGVAPSWVDKTGDSGRYEWNGGAAWTSLAYGFDTEPFTNTGLDKTSQLILHLRYRNHEQIPDPAMTGSFYAEDSFLAALRLRLGSPDFNASLDGAYVREWNSASHDGSSYRLAFVLERKMAANLWLRLSYGKEFDTPNGKDGSLFLGSFHLGASEEATAAPAAKP
jgi:hypothetical protein